MITNFEQLIKEAFSQSPKEVEAFFEEHFLKPLTTQLDGTETPAETIRHQRKQTNHIRNYLLSFARK